MDVQQVLRLSPSAVRAYRECAYSYALNYVRPLPRTDRRPIAALALGSAVHEAIARFLQYGGWNRKGKDELMALLPSVWKPAQFPDAQSESISYEQAGLLLESFFEHPYPVVPKRDLGIERSLSWHRPRQGILAVGKLDRICQLHDDTLEVIDFKTGRPPASDDALREDVQALFYRTLAAESFRWLSPPKTIVSFRYVGTAVTRSIEFDPVDFLAAWEDVKATAGAVTEARRAVEGGMPIIDAFPLHRGDRCRGCQFSRHCEKLEHQTS